MNETKSDQYDVLGLFFYAVRVIIKTADSVLFS